MLNRIVGDTLSSAAADSPWILALLALAVLLLVLLVAVAVVIFVQRRRNI